MANDEVARLKAELAALKGELKEVDEVFDKVDEDLYTTKEECSELKEDLACALTGAGNQGDTAFGEADIEILHSLIRFAHERGDTKAATLIAKGACSTLTRAMENRFWRHEAVGADGAGS